MTRRYQKVIIEGESSVVYSGVPQGTVLGTLMFLIYINGIACNMSLACRLFAGDCIIYHIVLNQKITVCVYKII